MYDWNKYLRRLLTLYCDHDCLVLHTDKHRSIFGKDIRQKFVAYFSGPLCIIYSQYEFEFIPSDVVLLLFSV